MQSQDLFIPFPCQFQLRRNIRRGIQLAIFIPDMIIMIIDGFACTELLVSSKLTFFYAESPRHAGRHIDCSVLLVLHKL